MACQIVGRMFCLGVVFSAILFSPASACAQTTLTGAIQVSASGNGTAIDYSFWNTLGGDHTFNLWLALNPDGTSPVNGPSDDQAAIDIPLRAGASYHYYTFGTASSSTGFHDLNLFFDGNNTTPGISVYGPVNTAVFGPNSNPTFALNASTVPGAGRTYYVGPDVVAVLTGFNWNTPATPPGDICQAYLFSPGTEAVYFGSFTLQVFPAATLSLNQTGDSPGTELILSGSQFAPGETVIIYSSRITSTLAMVVADAAGSFATTVREPQHPYGTIDFFALGHGSGRLGAATQTVTPSLTVLPELVAPGSTTTVQGLGFGADETVTIALDEPRQVLGTITTDGAGSFVGSHALSVTIPANAARGLNGLIGTGASTGAVGIGKVNVN